MKYIITLEITSTDGDPRDWDFQELLGINPEQGESLRIYTQKVGD